MTDREAIITKIESLLDDAPVTDWLGGAVLADTRGLARNIVAVFEKAHTPTTPTDDEREALKNAIGYDPVPLSIRDHPEIRFEYRTTADRDGLIERILTAGFRRFERSQKDRREAARVLRDIGAEVPKPSADEREALAEIIDKTPATPALGQRAVDFWGDVVDSVLAAGFRRSEPQREPSDAQVALTKIRKAIDSEEGWVEFGHRVEAILHEHDWATESSNESVPCPECGQMRPFGLDFTCLDCNGVRYVSENDWYAHHGCGFEEEWKYQWEARKAVDAHVASCPWIEGEHRVAEALCAAENAGSESWGMATDEQREWYISQARAALRAAFEVGGEGR